MARRKSTQSGIPNFDETIADIRNRVILSVAPLQKLQDIDGCFYQIGDLSVGMVAILKDTAYTTEFLKITLPLIRQFDLSLNELLVSAYGNTQAFSDIDFSLEPANDGEPQLPLYNLIDATAVVGSAVILLKEVRTQIAETLQSDFFILPTSKQNVMIAPVGAFDTSVLEEVLYDCNRSGLIDQKTEFLSDHIFIHSRKTGRITMVE